MPTESTVDTGVEAPVESGSTESATQQDMFEGFDFGNMDFADSAEEKEKSESGSPETVEPASTEVVEPVATAPAPTAPKVQAPVAPQEAVTPAPTPPPPASEVRPEVYAAQLEAQRGRAIEELTKYYALDEKAAERFETEPMAVLSELAARLHLSVVQNAYTAVLQRLPEITHSTMDAINGYQREEDKFYKAWPQFSRENPDHGKVLLTYGQLFRQTNPSASAEEFTKYVGAAAAAHLGLRSPAKGQRKAVPHTPAAAGGGNAPASGSGEPKPTQIEEMIAVWQAGQA